MEETQIILPGMEREFEIDMFMGKCITLGQAWRREHLEILGEDNMRFCNEKFERDSRIRHEKSCPVCLGLEEE